MTAFKAVGSVSTLGVIGQFVHFVRDVTQHPARGCIAKAAGERAALGSSKPPLSKFFGVHPPHFHLPSHEQPVIEGYIVASATQGGRCGPRTAVEARRCLIGSGEGYLVSKGARSSTYRIVKESAPATYAN